MKQNLNENLTLFNHFNNQSLFSYFQTLNAVRYATLTPLIICGGFGISSPLCPPNVSVHFGLRFPG